MNGATYAGMFGAAYRRQAPVQHCSLVETGWCELGQCYLKEKPGCASAYSAKPRNQKGFC